MKPFLKTSLLAFLITMSAFSFTSCEENNDSCQETACTLVFVSVNATIKDQNQDPVVLDSYELINTETNAMISLSSSPAELAQLAQEGIYPIMDDLSINQNQQLNIQLRGFLNNQQVITENYTVAKDCCHVSLVSGETEITL